MNDQKMEVRLLPQFLVVRDLGGGLFVTQSWSKTDILGLFWTWSGWNKLPTFDFVLTSRIDPQQSLLDLMKVMRERGIPTMD